MIEIKTKTMPATPRSKKYPVGASVLHTSGGTTIMQGGGSGESVDIVKRDDIRSFTDANVLSALRALAEFISKKDDGDITAIVNYLNGLKVKGNHVNRLLLKDTETDIMSDTDVMSALRVLSEIAANNEDLKGKFLSKLDPDETKHLLRLLGGLYVENGIHTDTLEASGNISAQNISATETISGQDVTASENITGKNVSATESVSGQSISATETISGKNITASETVSTQNVDATGTVSANMIDATETISGKNVLASESVAGENITASNTASGKNVTAKETISGKNATISQKTTTLNLLVQALANVYDLNVSHVATLFQTVIKDYISSELYTPGLTGSGMKLYKAVSGDWNLELDNLTVRKAMTIFELIISKIRAVNGGLVVSPANGKVKSVLLTNDIYRLEIEGDMMFVADDLVRCQTFAKTGTKYYWVRITSVSGQYIFINKTEFTSSVPAVGDDLVQFGNKTNAARQGVLYLTASEDGKPRFSVLNGVNSTDLTGKTKVILGCLDGITDTAFSADSQPFGYGLYSANVFLKGIFVLRNGKTFEDELNGQITAVQTAFEIREGQISSKVTEATTAATNAKKSETSASTSASTATTKATAAASSATSASTSATTATTKANAAASSATAASGSATTAGQKATAAANSATAAAGSATAAQKAAESAETVLEEVTTKESSITQTAGQIATKVTEVNKKVTEATTAATTATTKATAAANSATTAGTKATAAANSATAAAGAATNAKSSADSAAAKLTTITEKESSINQTASQISTKVTEVTKKATEAATSASNAASSATSASGSASTATTKATAAAGSAAAAATSATNAKSSADTAAAKLTTITQKESSINQTASSITTKVTEVNTKASQAATSATNAANSASTAGTKATAAANSAELALAMSKGKMIYRDPSFKSGSNSCSVYNNSGNGNVTVTRVSGIAGNPNSSGYCLKVKTTGTASPERGGFHWGATAKANRVLIVRLIANIPTGYTLKFATNALGTGASHKWLTAYVGTGKWEEYAYKIVCGASGTFSSTGFFYLSGGSTPTTAAPLEWHICYATMFDVTDAEIDYISDAAAKYTTKTEHTSSITQLSNSIELKVAKTDFNALGTRVSSAETTIKQHTDSIALKAAKTDVTALGTRMTAAEAKITPDAIKLTVKSQTDTIAANAASNAVNGIKIGGKNLIRYVTDTGAKYFTGSGATVTVTNGIVRGVSACSTAGWPRIFNSSVRNIVFELNTPYTVSFWVRSNIACTRSFGIAESGGTKAIFTKGTAITTAWTHVIYTFTPTIQVGTAHFFYIYTGSTSPNTDTTNWVEIKEVKLEKGNKATDWTPAPEDVATDAQSKADAAKQAAITDAAGKYTTKTEHSSSITQLNNSIALKVAKTDFNALGTRVGSAETTIKQHTDQIALKAAKTDVTALGTRVSAAEAKITPDAIKLTVKSQTETIAANAAKRTEVWVDATALDASKYYPVTMVLATSIPMYTITVDRTLNTSYGKPSWSTHTNGFSVVCKWSTNASGWGTIGVKRTVLDYTYNHANVVPVGNIGQMTNTSREYVYVRGGSKYRVTVEGATGVSITLQTAAYTVSSQTVGILTAVTAPVPNKDAINTRITNVETQFEIREGVISTKVTEATTAATNAKKSETSASTSASTATTKATAAASSATSASGSATTAGQKATAAANSATAAATSATNAKSSADAAAAKLTTITQKESSINQTASSITTKVTEVTTKAAQAATSAANAKTSETNAGTKATAAANSATAAASSATSAAASLTSVTTKQSEINAKADQITLKVTEVTTKTTQATNAAELATAMSKGKMLYRDPTFKDGKYNGTAVYLGTGATRSYVAVTGCPNPAAKAMKIVATQFYTATDKRIAGFYFANTSRANAVFVVRIIANIPTGRNLNVYHNSYGTGGATKWLTSTAGAGKWTEYACKVTCGASGTFSTLNYFALTGGAAPTAAAPVTWYVAYATVFDVTDVDDTPSREEIKSGMTITAGGISIFGKELSLAGKVTFSSLDSAAQSTINGKATPAQVATAKSEAISTAATDATTKANNAKSAAISTAATDATTKANNAKSAAISAAATDATTKANNALTNARNDVAVKLGYTSYTDMVNKATAKQTIIDGGFIRTSLIKADDIVTSTLLATKIAATEITTGKLTVTTGAKIGGWNVIGNSLTIQDESEAKILVEPSGYRFLRINDTKGTLMSIRADGVTGIGIYTQDKSGTCLSMIAQTGGTAVESYGSHTFGQRAGETWNAPGALWAGRISARGTVENYWGNGCTVSSQRTGVGQYRIDHNLGHTDYFVMITGTPYSTNGDKWIFGMIANRTKDYFTVQILDPGSGVRDAAFEVVMTGRNKF